MHKSQGNPIHHHRATELPRCVLLAEGLGRVPRAGVRVKRVGNMGVWEAPLEQRELAKKRGQAGKMTTGVPDLDSITNTCRL